MTWYAPQGRVTMHGRQCKEILLLRLSLLDPSHLLLLLKSVGGGGMRQA